MTDTPIDTVTLPTVPLSATNSWKAAVAAAAGQCQCTGCGKTHRATGGRCGNHQGRNGTRLHLATDGNAYCGPCLPHHSTTPARAAPAIGQGDLLALLTGA
ncbi:MAG TPA: hypothetical protein VGS97_05175 [Actinocrinis sp.]|uniref:hypothetical protein n=1 Tax=Actinocrinis sp. TaxID=1920516 RepID=UPI002DDCD0E9|nr:hypothetical protein [Actinocrinis sp.]HEV2343465.1 hypothetical protein [Actinocrinis sp.]